MDARLGIGEEPENGYRDVEVMAGQSLSRSLRTLKTTLNIEHYRKREARKNSWCGPDYDQQLEQLMQLTRYSRGWQLA